MNTNSWLNQLQSTGCRLTGARRVVVQVMESSQRALTPVEVYDAARKQDPHIGLVTVYRTLEKLEDLGLIQRVHQTKDCQAFYQGRRWPSAPDCLYALWQSGSVRRRPA